uniref:Uncharacterized protein n=1 Tax=Fagus sylvatica TaxID=28930 RepID=A0A2N9EMW6_FAGSY
MHKMSRSKQTQESPIEILQDDSIEAVEESKAMECIETDEIPEVEPQKQSNGKMISCNAITLPREFMATSWVQRENEARGVSPILLADDEDCQETGIVKFTGIDQNGNPSRVTVGPEKPLTMEDLFKLNQDLEETKISELEDGLNYYVEE